MKPFISALLLCGGRGTRFGGPTPKQYMMLSGKKIAHYSLDVLLSSPHITEVIIVCDTSYQEHFSSYMTDNKIVFALSGNTRQESVYSGLCSVSTLAQYVCVHDGARPFLTHDLLEATISQAITHGAAALAVPAKNTIKMVSSTGFVAKTLERESLVEMQTPQALCIDILKQGMKLAKERNILASDDVSLAELIDTPVKIVTSTYSNIKITTKEDMALAQVLLGDSYA